MLKTFTVCALALSLSSWADTTFSFTELPAPAAIDSTRCPMPEEALITALPQKITTVTTEINPPPITNNSSLPGILAHTLSTNPTLHQQYAAAQASLHAVRAAKAGYLPTVDLHFAQGYEFSDSPSLRAAGLSSEDLHRQESDVQSTQVLFQGGRIRNLVHESVAFSNAEKLTFLSERETISFATAQAYLNVLREQALLQLAKDNVQNHRRIYRKILTLFQKRATHRANVELAKSRLTQTQANQDKVAQNLAIAVANYQGVTGLAPKNLRFTLRTPYLPKTSLSATLQTTQTINTQILSEQNQVEATNATIAVNKANFYPTLSAQLSAGYNRDIDGIKGKNNDALAMLVLNYNLFRGGADEARVREAVERHVEAEDKLQSLVRGIRAQTEQLWHILFIEKSRLIKLKRYILESRALQRSYRKQFLVGSQTLFNVLDAESQYNRSRVALTNAQYDDTLFYYQLLALENRLTQTLEGLHG